MILSRARRPFNAALPILILVAIGVIWQIAVSASTARVQIIPAPTEILAEMIDTRVALLMQHIPTTLLETLLGLALALVIGVALAALLDFSSLLRRVLYPLLIISQTIPLIALAPVLILIFGFEIEPKVIVAFLFCVFPIVVATLDGLSSTDPDYVLLLLSMGANRLQIWRKVRLPSALPGFFSGLRIATTYSVTGAIFGEYVTSKAGLGNYMRSAYSAANIPRAFAAIVITAVLSILLVGIAAGIERLTIPWFYARQQRSGWSELD